MKLLTMTLIMLCNLSFAGDEARLSTIPSQPSAKSQFLLQYQWTIDGCLAPFLLNSDGSEYGLLMEADRIRMFVHVGNASCWSPWSPELGTKNFSFNGLEEGEYTLQLYFVHGDTNQPLPGPGDVQILVAESQFRVGPAPQTVDMWSNTALAILMLLLLLVTYHTQKGRIFQHRNN